ncbi:hypothetical protein GCK32_017358, partial [Trichostrongylus colubriformis]
MIGRLRVLLLLLYPITHCFRCYNMTLTGDGAKWNTRTGLQFIECDDGCLFMV